MTAEWTWAAAHAWRRHAEAPGQLARGSAGYGSQRHRGSSGSCSPPMRSEAFRSQHALQICRPNLVQMCLQGWHRPFPVVERSDLFAAADTAASTA